MNKNNIDDLIDNLLDSNSTADEISTITKEFVMLQDRKAINPLLHRLAYYDDPYWIRKHLVFALGGLEALEAKEILLDIFFADETQVELKEITIIALGYIGATEIVVPLMEIVKTGKPRELLYASVVALGYIRDLKSIIVLTKALDSEEFLIPQTAAEALAKFGVAAKQAIPQLQKLVDKGNDAEKHSALDAIAQIRGT